MGFNVLGQVPIQVLLFFGGVYMFLFIYGSVQVQDKFLYTKGYFSRFAKSVGMYFFQQLKYSGLQSVESDNVIVKGTIPLCAGQFHNIHIVRGFLL